MKYTLAITNENMDLSFKYFVELEDARAALKEFVINPIKEYIKDFDSTHTLVVQKIGKKKKLYTRQLPYEIVQGSDYISLMIRERNQFILGGVIAETARIDQILADNSVYANISFDGLEDDEEEN